MALDLGKILLKHRIITTKELDRARSVDVADGIPLARFLVKLGSVTEDQIATVVSAEFAIPSIKLKGHQFEQEVVELVPPEFAEQYCIIPLSRKGRALTLATTDPTNVFVMDEIKFMTGLEIELVVSTESDITTAIKKLYGGRQLKIMADVHLGEDFEAPVLDRKFDPITGERLRGGPTFDLAEPIERPLNYTVVKIFYATDRKQTGEQSPGKFYGGERSEEDSLIFGTCDVSIPRDHLLAHIERPSWRNLYREDPAKHVVLLSLNTQTKDNYFSELSADVISSKRKQVLVFIHGFDVNFEEGAWRMAQLAYDLGFDGPPILYSWPSIGRLRDYTVDEATFEWCVPHLKGLLKDIGEKCGAQMVHVVAHSMGNRILANALKEIALTAPQNELPLVQEVILTAPDIDAGVFRQIAGEIQKAAKRVTLYASSNDKALEASKKIHGGPRAGDSGEGIVVVPGVDTIDASAVDTSFIGHSYYGDNRTVLSDIFHLLLDGFPPDKRFGLRQKSLLNSVYWAFLGS